MNISQNIDNFRPDTVITLAAGEHRTIDQTGRYFIFKSNSLTTDVQVAIGNSQHYTPWPVLWSFQTRSPDDYFEKIKFYNPAAVPMTIDFFISTDWIDNKSAEITGTVSVNDITDGTSTPASIIVQPRGGVLINNADAVWINASQTGIPVTGHTFVAGDSITITGTVNYDGVYTVLPSSTVNQVDITIAMTAETFDGVDDTIALTTPRSIAADPTRKELHIANHSASHKVYWGDANVDAAAYRGVPIPVESIYIITCTDRIYLTCEAAAGIAGCRVSWANKTKT